MSFKNPDKLKKKKKPFKKAAKKPEPSVGKVSDKQPPNE
jgi:hypothetical protein